MSVAHVQQIAQKILDSLGLGLVVQFQVERNPAAAGISVPQGVVPTGGTGNGQIYLFAPNLLNEVEVFSVVFHELFHLGLSQSSLPPIHPSICRRCAYQSDQRSQAGRR